MAELIEKDFIPDPSVPDCVPVEIVRTTKVTKGINRKVWTAKYEGIEVCSHVEEIIEWRTLKERQQKLDAVAQHVVNDFKRTFNTVMIELGLNQVSAFGTADKEDTKIENKNIDIKSVSKELFDGLE